MKKIILATVATMLSMQAWGEVKTQPSQLLKAKAYVYKVKEVQLQDGTYDDVNEEVCKKDIQIPLFKGDTNDESGFASENYIDYCHGKILDKDVTVAFGSLVYDALVLPGKITNQYGINAWINKRANMVMGMTWAMPGHLKPKFDKEKGYNDWGSDSLSEDQFETLQDLIPTGDSSVSIFRGSINQGFMSFLELQNSNVCGRIPDQDRKEKCYKDGYFRVLITFEGKN